jgi:molybdopterin-dependent oxidoreductase alpha subunit
MNDGKEPRITSPKDFAGGLPAVVSSLRHLADGPGLVRGARALLEMNQKGGFDCPSCAWPDPDGDRPHAEFCENGAKALASEATRRLADEAFFANHSVAELLEQDDLWLEKQGRIARPMVLREGATHYQPIDWDDAFALVAEHLKGLSIPDEAIFYTSGRASNEAAFLYQLFVRSYGTNNLPDCSNMCHESSGVALKQSIGVGKGTVTMADFLEADTILCVGQNPGTNHPRMLTTLEEAVNGGAKLVAVNPLREAGLVGFAHPQNPRAMLGRVTPLASRFVRVRVNGDLALFRGVAKALLEEENVAGGVVDQQFVAEHTAFYDEYRKSVAVTDWSTIVEMSGVPEDDVRQLAKTLLGGSRRVITCWAMGLTQHRNSVATIREIANVHLLLGAIGRPGAGLCPVRGHSNVQGDRTMGIWEKMPESFLAALDRECGITAPRRIGFDTVESILAMDHGKASVFIALGGNFLQASPDTHRTARALSKCALTCQISTKLNRSHLVTGRVGLILPCLGRSERDGPDARFVSCENSMGVVQLSRGVLAPVSPDLRSEIEIIAGMADASLKPNPKVRWKWLAEDYDRIRDLIERVIPGFENYNQRVRAAGGFYLPNSAKARIWGTPNRRASFAITTMDVFQPAPGRLVLQTLRSHDQFNTTIYGPHDRYRGIGNARRIVLVHPAELVDRGIRPGTPVDITSFWSDGERIIRGFMAIPYEMPPGTAAAYFPEANALVPATSQALESGTPTSKSVEIQIAPAAATAGKAG